ncbi:MAG: molybdopterin-guanine dinucleotide biosynthesis protein A [Planctomycetaceae bacterium]|nr:molybdopterin-guanine dinucleotide biosynthesis protein A [Planctomycetaceae bacterium]
MKVGGIILCGGRSSRMGQPKAWLPFGDETMLQRTVRVLREVVHPVIVVAAPEQDVPELPPDVAIVRDEIEGKGPLGGLAAGLTALNGVVDAVYLSACDVPFLKPEFVRRVLELLGEASVAVPRVGDYFHPLATVYRVSVLPHVRELLAADRLRPPFLFDVVSTRIIEPHELADVDPDFRSLRNVNTPDEYGAALKAMSDV